MWNVAFHFIILFILVTIYMDYNLLLARMGSISVFSRVHEIDPLIKKKKMKLTPTCVRKFNFICILITFTNIYSLIYYDCF